MGGGDQNNKIDLCRRVDRMHVHWTLVGESACFVFRIVTIVMFLSYAAVVSVCRMCKKECLTPPLPKNGAHQIRKPGRPWRCSRAWFLTATRNTARSFALPAQSNRKLRRSTHTIFLAAPPTHRPSLHMGAYGFGLHNVFRPQSSRQDSWLATVNYGK